jgi:glycosyltransferase involved in cell wall biosynthesis
VLRTAARVTIDALLALPGLALLLGGAVLAILRGRPGPGDQPRLLWGTTPLKSLTYMSRALAEGGYESDTVVTELYPILERADFDHHLHVRGRAAGLAHVGSTVKAYLFLASALSRYDVFHYFFDGGVLRHAGLRRLELPLLRLLGKRIVLMPYGSDTWILDRVPDLSWRHALAIEYGELGNRAAGIERRLRRLTSQADVVVGCVVHVACLPRWDVLPVAYFPVDTARLQPVPPRTDGPIRIAHAANHRGAKGTEFLIAAVERLRAKGNDIELILIERLPNDEALNLIAGADVYVDQLVFAYGLAAQEGMALGKVVVSALDNSPAYQVFRRYSYLGECPIVPATVDTIDCVLRDLIVRRSEWPAIGRRSRAYVERRHSPAACRELYEAIYSRIWHEEEVDLINLYHPLHGKAQTASVAPPRRSASVERA